MQIHYRLKNSKFSTGLTVLIYGRQGLPFIPGSFIVPFLHPVGQQKQYMNEANSKVLRSFNIPVPFKFNLEI